MWEIMLKDDNVEHPEIETQLANADYMLRDKFKLLGVDCQSEGNDSRMHEAKMETPSKYRAEDQKQRRR